MKEMKRILSALLVFTLMAGIALIPAFSSAEESAAAVLTFEELNSFVESIVKKAMSQQPMTEGGEPAYIPEDGYALVYEFGIIYCDKPVLDEDTVINEIVITSPEEAGPRGIHVDSGFSELLQAFYSENDNLTGDRSFAGLYAGNFMPEYAVWAWVQRDGQNIQSVQYAVHDELASGGDGYTDCGILYTIQDMAVSAIRIYGLNSKITAEQAVENVSTVQSLMQVSAYERVPSASFGDDVLPFGRQDLIMDDVDFAVLTPESAVAFFGEAVEDEWMDDGENGTIRVMDFPGCSITFTCDTNRENPKIYMVYIPDDVMEGPRSIRVGDSLTSVIDRFPSGKGTFDGSTEVLYGTEESGDWGTAQYSSDGTAACYYKCTFEGQQVTLYISFENMAVEEIMIIFG